MIDIEQELFDLLSGVLEDAYPSIFVTGEEVNAPSEFPCVSIVEADNYTKASTQDSGSSENHAVLMYEVTVFSNKVSGRKSQCREIAVTVSDFFQSKGFARLSMTPAPGGVSYYRLVCRFTASVSADQKIFRR